MHLAKFHYNRHTYIYKAYQYLYFLIQLPHVMNDLRSSLLHLQSLTLADADFVYQLYTNDLVCQSYESPPISSKEESVPFIQRITQPDCFVFLIGLLPDRQPAGVCALHHWNKTKETIEIGGTLLPDYWGRGIMKETFRLLLSFAYETLGVKSVLANTQTTNIKAIRMATKLGFQKIHTKGSETTLVHKAFCV